jgi:hypothetical protein
MGKSVKLSLRIYDDVSETFLYDFAVKFTYMYGILTECS